MAEEGIVVPVSLEADLQSTLKAGEQLGKELSDAVEKSTDINISEKFRKNLLQAQKFESQLTSVNKELQEMSALANQQVTTAPYEQATRQLMTYQTELDKAKEKVAELNDKSKVLDMKLTAMVSNTAAKQGISGSAAKEYLEENSAAYVKLVQDINKTKEATAEAEAEWDNAKLKINQLNEAISHLESSGQAFTTLGQTAQFQDEYASKLAKSVDLTNKLKMSLGTLDEGKEAPNYLALVGKSALEAGSSIAKLTKRLIQLTTSAIKSGIGKLSGAFKGLSKDSEDSAKSFKKALKTFIKYGFGVRSFFFLFRKIRSAISESIKSLKDASFGDVGESLNALSASLQYLKDSWAAAFAPIITFVTPALVKLMDALSAIMNTIGAFISMLTGKTFYVKAVKQTGALADATAAGAKAQKEWNNELYSFDELNRQSDQKDSSGGSGSGGGVNFEETPIGGALSDWLEDWTQRLKEAWGSDAFYEVGDILAEGLEHALTMLDDWINNTFRPWGVKWAGNLAEIVNGFFERWSLWDVVGKTISDGLASVLDIASTFLEKTHFDSIGKAFGKALKAVFANDDMWDQISRFMSAKLNSLINLINGFIDETINDSYTWGRRVASAFLRIIENIKWQELAQAIVNGVQWIINFLSGLLSDTQRWNEASQKFTDALNYMIENVNLEDLATQLNELLARIGETLKTINWYELGYKIGQFLGTLDWVKILLTVGQIIVETLWGALNGALSTDNGKATLFGLALVTVIMGGLSAGLSILKLKFTAELTASIVGPMLGITPSIETAGATMATATETAAGSVIGALKAATPTLALIAGAFADAAIIAYDVNKLKEASDVYHEAENASVEESDKAMDTYKKLYETKGKEVADEWAKMAYNIDTTGKSLEESQKALSDQVSTYWDDVPKDMWEGFSQGWDSYFGKDGSGLSAFCKDALKSLIDMAKSIFGIHSPSTVFEGIGTDLVKGLLNGISRNWNSLTSFVNTSMRNLTSFFTTSWNTIKTNATTAWTNLGTTIKNLWNNVKSSLMSVDFTSIGSHLVNGIRNGITNGWHAITSAINNLCSGLVNSVRNMFQIHSPSKVFAEIGSMLSLGLAEGITESADTPVDAMDNVAESVSDVNFALDNLPTSLDTALAKLAIIADKFTVINEALLSMSRMPIPAVAMGSVTPSVVRTSQSDAYAPMADAIVSAITNANSTTSTGSTPMNPVVKIYIRGKEVFDAVVDENNSAIMRMGRSPLMR